MNSKYKYITYNNEIYIVFGLYQDKFNNMFFHIIKLDEIKHLIVTNSLYLDINLFLSNLVIPINEVNEIKEPSQIDFLQTLYE